MSRSGENIFLLFSNVCVIQVHMACGGWDMHERRTSIADIRAYLSEMDSSQPPPEWLFAMLDLFEQEDVPATYVYTRCRALGSVASTDIELTSAVMQRQACTSNIILRITSLPTLLLSAIL